MTGESGLESACAAVVEYNAAMRRLPFILRSVMLAALCWLTACASTVGTERNAPSAAAVQGPMPVTLTLWHSWSGAKLDALNALARRYEQANPNVRIRLEAQPAASLVRDYTMKVADGSAPQLLLVRNRYVGELAAGQYIAPLDGVVGDDVLSQILPAAVDGARVDGTLYGTPLAYDTLVLFYDRRRVAAPPATITETLTLNATQPDPKPRSLGYYLSLETTLPYLHAFGGAVLDQAGQPVFAAQNRAATIAWLSWLVELQKQEPAVVSPDYNAVDAFVQRGEVLAVVDWARRRANYVQLWGADAVGVAPLPMLDNGAAPQPMVYSDVLSVNTVVSAEQRTAAEAFLRYMLDKSVQQTLAERGQMLPVYTGLAADDQARQIWTIATAAQPLTSPMVAMQEPLSAMLRGVLLNTITPDEAIDTAQSALPSASP